MIKEKLFILCIVSLICFSILEVGLRFKGDIPTNMASGILNQYENSYRLKTNFIKEINWPAYSYTVYTNALGFRDKSIGPKDLDNYPYHVFLGASEVFGNGVNYENTFVGIFSEAARKMGINVINMAIGGHYFLDQEGLFKDFIRHQNNNPKIVYFCINDLHIPKYDRRNNHVIVKQGMLFEKSNWRMAYVKAVLGNTLSSYCFLRDNIRNIQSKYFDFKPTDTSAGFLRIYSKSNKMRNPQEVIRFEAYLDAFNSYCYANKITPIYIYTPIIDSYRLFEILVSVGEDPTDYDTEYYENILIRYCQRNDIKLLNLKSLLHPYFNDGIDLRFKLDPHYNEFANRIIGEYLVQEIFD